jgi:hypothetical protein
MRSRTRPNCDIEEGYLSASLCHLGNIAHRVRGNLAFDTKTTRFKDDNANNLLTREYRDGYVVPNVV